MEEAEWRWDWKAERKLCIQKPLIGWTDAGPTGNGSWIEGRGQGITTEWDADTMSAVSSAALEIRGIRALIVGKDLKDEYVVVYGDAQAAVGAVMAGRGESKGTSKEIRELLREVRERRLALDVEWISRTEGIMPYVDALARRAGTKGIEKSAEWVVTDVAFERVMTQLGVRPTVDLFARERMHRLGRRCSRIPVEGAAGTGHLFPLTGEIPYIYPPWTQMRRALTSLGRRGAREAVIVQRQSEECDGWKAFKHLVACPAACSPVESRHVPPRVLTVISCLDFLNVMK
jgi:hypothetical protein